MRILVLQLARFGDIYQTWPALRALKRSHPDCELHLLVREKFSEAAAGLPGVKVHKLPTQDILSPILTGGSDEESVRALEAFLQPLEDLRFDRIINLSFSPVSSYLTWQLANSECEVRGYTRQSDGHLAIPDDTSAYFYAQVGVGRANRYHVSEIFAAAAGVDLAPEDFTTFPAGMRAGIVVHIGASQIEKSYPPELWVETLKLLSGNTLTLIGSPAERALSETIAAQVPGVLNRVGETSLTELLTLIHASVLVIGADSAPMHMASLCATPALNLSSSRVNFWETGPVTPSSRVLFAKEIHTIAPARVAAEAKAILQGEPPKGPCAERPGYLGTYRLHGTSDSGFEWDLIQALYTGTDYPDAPTSDTELAFQRLFELTELAGQQLAQWEKPEARTAAARILDQVDLLITEVGELQPPVKPAVEWFKTEKLRIGPSSDEEILSRTRKAYADLQLVASVYRRFRGLNDELNHARELARVCIPEIRECQLPKPEFQNLLSVIHELARASTKVASPVWSSVVSALNSALERADFIELADLLQWTLMPALEAMLNQQETTSQDMLS